MPKKSFSTKSMVNRGLKKPPKTPGNKSGMNGFQQEKIVKIPSNPLHPTPGKRK